MAAVRDSSFVRDFSFVRIPTPAWDFGDIDVVYGSLIQSDKCSTWFVIFRFQ